MSVCSGCPWPGEVTPDDVSENPSYYEEDGCPEFGCSFEDAAYRAQEAYRRLEKRYNDLQKEYNELKKKVEEKNSGC